MTTGDKTPWRWQALDAIVYVVAVTVIVVVASIAISFALGGDWLGVKYILFIVGFVLFGIGTLKLRPTAAWRKGDGNREKALLQTGRDSDHESESWLQARIQRVPPLDRYGLRPNERLSDGAKLFLASVLILLLSFVLESVFGIAR